MHSKWLEDFIALAQTRSFARAAEARFVTQPALGWRIKALEAWLGLVLIDRSSYPTQLTPAGEAFVDTAQGKPAHALLPVGAAPASAHVAPVELAETLALARIWANTTPACVKAQLRPVPRADFAEPLVPLVRASMGLAWLPLSLVAQDLKRGTLMLVGTLVQDTVCQVNLVRHAKPPIASLVGAPYNGCVLLMPSLRHAAPGVTVVRLGQWEDVSQEG